MKKVLGLIGSPRKLGNCEIMVKEVFKNLNGNWEYELIRLTDLKILHCTACFVCTEQGKSCNLEDDFDFLLEKIKESEAVIISAPCYSLGPSGVIKLIQDRLLLMHTQDKSQFRKPCLSIAVSGQESWSGYSKSALAVTAHLFGFRLLDSFLAIGANPAEVLFNKKNLEWTKEAARLIKNNEVNTNLPGNFCPACFSDIFKIEENSEIRCTMCDLKGKIVSSQGKMKIEFNDFKDHRFTEKSLKYHYENWLSFKKEEFIKERLKLKELRIPYKNIGNWLTPNN